MAETKRILNTYTTYSGPDDLFTLEEQVEQCCEPVIDHHICADVGLVGPYSAADISEFNEKVEELKKKYGNIRRVIIKTVGPDGDCGKKYTEWVADRNCCDGVPALTWDSALSVSVLAPSSEGAVKVNGGKTPIEWKVRGSGFWTDAAHTQKDITTYGTTITIYTDADACGTCNIVADDKCSKAIGAVLSTQGQWDSVSPCAGATTLVYWFISGSNIHAINENDGLRDHNTYYRHSTVSSEECDVLMETPPQTVDCVGKGGYSSTYGCLVPFVVASYKWGC